MNHKIVAWNTGRLYTSHGQRIAATVLEDGRVAFNDIDRGITGITQQSFDPRLDGTIEEFVMREYDHVRYTGGVYLPPDYKPMTHLAEALDKAARTVG